MCESALVLTAKFAGELLSACQSSFIPCIPFFFPSQSLSLSLSPCLFLSLSPYLFLSVLCCQKGGSRAELDLHFLINMNNNNNNNYNDNNEMQMFLIFKGGVYKGQAAVWGGVV